MSHSFATTVADCPKTCPYNQPSDAIDILGTKQTEPQVLPLSHNQRVAQLLIGGSPPSKNYMKYARTCHLGYKIENEILNTNLNDPLAQAEQSPYDDQLQFPLDL